jgi:hypothetical protein
MTVPSRKPPLARLARLAAPLGRAFGAPCGACAGRRSCSLRCAVVGATRRLPAGPKVPLWLRLPLLGLRPRRRRASSSERPLSAPPCCLFGRVFARGGSSRPGWPHPSPRGRQDRSTPSLRSRSHTGRRPRAALTRNRPADPAARLVRARPSVARARAVVGGSALASGPVPRARHRAPEPRRRARDGERSASEHHRRLGRDEAHDPRLTSRGPGGLEGRALSTPPGR